MRYRDRLIRAAVGVCTSVASVAFVHSQVECGESITASTTLTTDLACLSDGITISAPGVVLDCDGHAIRGSGDAAATGIRITAMRAVAVRNCTVTGFDTAIPNVRTGTVDANGAVWFGNTAQSTQVVRINGELTGQPTFTLFDTGVAGPSLPISYAGALWFGNGSGSPQVVRITGDLAGTPTIALIDTTVPSAGFPIADAQGEIWFGTTDPGASTQLTRVG